jgi:hypothetical protein
LTATVGTCYTGIHQVYCPGLHEDVKNADESMNRICSADLPMLGLWSRPVAQYRHLQTQAPPRLQSRCSAFGKAPTMSHFVDVSVPATFAEANAVFCSHPSAAVPLAGIALMATARLQQPLGVLDGTGAYFVLSVVSNCLSSTASLQKVGWWLVCRWVHHLLAGTLWTDVWLCLDVQLLLAWLHFGWCRSGWCISGCCTAALSGQVRMQQGTVSHSRCNTWRLP